MSTPTFHEPKYAIEAPSFVCAICSQEIPCEGVYFSAVFFEEAFRRRDYCPTCWGVRFPRLAQPTPEPRKRGGKAPPEPTQEVIEPDVIAFWRARRPKAPEAKPTKLRFDPEVVLEFFRRLAPRKDKATSAGTQGGDGQTQGLPDAERDELRFVLALLLLRRKVLAFASSQIRDGQEWLKLSEKKDPGRHHWVRNPELTDSRLEKLRDRIGELLNMQV